MHAIQQSAEVITKDKDNVWGGRRQYWFAIKELTAREIKRKYARSYLGIVWSILNPLLNMMVMSLIFSYMFIRSIQNFPLYYLTGQIFWAFFNNATNTSMTALVDNKIFLIRTKLPKQTFVLSRIYTATVNLGYTLVAYICILALYRVKLSWVMFLFIPDMFLFLLFTLGCSYVLSILYVFFADIKHLYGILLTLWMYMSALFYPVESLPYFMQEIIGYNPVYLSIYIARECMVYGRMPHYSAWIKLCILAIGMFFWGYFMFKRNKNKLSLKL